MARKSWLMEDTRVRINRWVATQRREADLVELAIHEHICSLRGRTDDPQLVRKPGAQPGDVVCMCGCCLDYRQEMAKEP